MVQLREADYQLLHEYKEMLLVIEEGFTYVTTNLREEAPPQVQDVFNDLLAAFQRINTTHTTLSKCFEEDEELDRLLDDYKVLITNLTGWFEMHTNVKKKELLDKQIIPQFVQWRDNMLTFIEPYTIQ
ncbi:hypothetical protein BN1058_00669 [Paraliobacillus sp. PM-2]|uniref:hypothetical protein n=1 Tax=Paraliobacillus sp. PM-2 TaxID=1462524 RepID=UPI00061C7EA7|nr:hypothetical protein [Paraliobacillus sp. PM-2]CQR46409.1 hypothetical protein BN1058_00669 [Paraliobacillus sp. PM-2]